MTVITPCFKSTSFGASTPASWKRYNSSERKQTVCVFVLGDPVCFFPLVRSVVSLSLSLPIRAAGVLARFLAAVKTAPGKILSCKDRDTISASVCVSLPGSYPDIIIKGDICVTDFFSPGKWVCVQHNSTNLTPWISFGPLVRTTDSW